MDNKKRMILLIVISGLIILTLSLGLTYAFMKPQVEENEEKSNININACAKVQLKDNNSNSINLQNTYPMDDEKGLETKPYEFTINSTCENYVGFNLYLTTLTTNEIEDNAIHFAITSKDNVVLVSNILSSSEDALSKFNLEELKELDLGIKGTHKNIYKVYSNNVPLKGESEYKLYLWVDKDISEEATMNKSFTVGLSIKSFNREEMYADNCDKNLATCQIAQKVYENNTLFYHDTNLNNGANDLSYRFSGASDVVNNYVCLDNLDTDDCDSDDDLYRIIGIFKNEEGNYELKLIKAQGATITELGDSDTATGGAYYGKYIYGTSSHGPLYYKGTNYDNLGMYYWNNSNGTDSGNVNMWKESNLNKINLNNYFYNYITTIKAPYLENHITNHEWIVGGAYNIGNAKVTYNYELGTNKTKNTDKRCYTQGDTSTAQECNGEYDLIYPAHIGLMYLSDYMYATTQNNWITLADNYNNETVRDNNWMYMGLYEWTISRFSSDGYHARNVTSRGYANGYDGTYYMIAVRPSFYLTSDAKISKGEGSKEKPYRITFE